MTVKPKVAFYWCASCGGCEETVVDLGARVLDVVAAVDIVFWPCALDFKTADLAALADGAISVAFVNGAVRTSEQAHMAELLRRKAACVIAFGACACHGGIPALANLTSRERILQRSYHASPTVDNPAGTEPRESTTIDGHRLNLPAFADTVHKLSDVIAVDYSMPGCPPTPDNLWQAVNLILTGKLPPRGAVLGSVKSLCSSCPRNDSRPDDPTIPKIRRLIDVVVDPATCLLAQGLVCMGPATRDGCGARCIEGNMPCTGCYGPAADVQDQGARMVSALGTILQNDAGDQGTAALDDPAGTFYRYTMAASLLGAERKDV
ncbi:MAG: oxidoreductase [Lentisphaerae bacterium RIFOXYB12_FULL_65_16]|nr:MAG: oxidoreductase [Lentisphaerae bacterium RIFOXYA12_64_32]OGV93576.1 MAG: oxidoreductase [Lentisphaerae bacterium RIFOXYB12_FULL_65_16]